MAVFSLTKQQRDRARYFLPPAIAGGSAWIVFMLLGHTPVIRASGLALIIVGMTLALRPMGMALAVIGGLAFAFSPSFWAQTGGAESLNAAEVLAALAAAAVGGGLVIAFSRRPFWGAALAILVFGGLFLAVIGTPRSLRLTTLLSAWSLYLLIDGLLVSNPRPEAPPTGELGAHHTFGLLLLLIVGVLNDPLFVLLAPAIMLGLFLSKKPMPLWYWLVLAGAAAYGLRALIVLYVDTGWWSYPAAQADAAGLHVPYFMADGWRNPIRWVRLMELIVSQYTVAGLALGVLGLARLARWYPPVGVVTMIAYGSFGLFGLIYFGADAPVQLLPLLMIQVFWMTYAVYAFGQWLQKSAISPSRNARWLVTAAFTLLPLVMLLRIAGVL